MKNIVLENIIEFITNVDISISNESFSGVLAGEIEIEDFYISVLESSPFNSWITIKENMKLDEVSSKLLENLSHAINTEDYMAASIIKKEVLNRMETLDEEYLWNVGRNYIFSLKEYSRYSDLCEDWVDTLKEIEYFWNTNKFKDHKYVTDKLIELENELTGYHKSVVYEDIRSFSDTNVSGHPYFNITDVVNFFKLISK